MLHGDGPAAAWAAAAAPGRAPRRRRRRRARRPAGRPAAAGRRRDRAARRSAGSSPRRRRPPAGVALLEVAGPAEEQPLAGAGRGGRALAAPRRRPPPGESTLLADAVAALDRPDGRRRLRLGGRGVRRRPGHPRRPARPVGAGPGAAPRDRLLAARPRHVAPAELSDVATGSSQVASRRPAAAAATLAAMTTASARATGGTVAGSSPDRGGPRPEARLLVVDDEPNIRELLSASLRYAGLRGGHGGRRPAGAGAGRVVPPRPAGARRDDAGPRRLRRRPPAAAVRPAHAGPLPDRARRGGGQGLRA